MKKNSKLILSCLFRPLVAATLALVFAVLPAWAEDDQTVLHLIFKDGTSTWFLLTEQPVLTFTDTQLEVNSSTVSASYDFADIEEYRFADLTTALRPLSKNETRFVRQNNDNILIEGCPAEAVSLYDLSGHRLAARMQQQSGGVSVSLRHLPAGIYLIRMNQQTIKVTKK